MLVWPGRGRWLAPILTEEERWQQLRRCLTDSNLPLEVRVAGSLILLYGIPGERLRHLATNQISGTTAEKTTLQLGESRLWVPPRMAELLHQLAEAPHQRSAMTRSFTDQPQWLLPGVIPGHPLSRKAFNDQLAREGIRTRSARTAALIALASELPAPVLADLLNLHIHTALKWARHAQRNWSAYLSARVEENPRKNPLMPPLSG